MKKVLVALAAVLFAGSAAYATDRGKPASRTQIIGWQQQMTAPDQPVIADTSQHVVAFTIAKNEHAPDIVITTIDVTGAINPALKCDVVTTIGADFGTITGGLPGVDPPSPRTLAPAIVVYVAPANSPPLIC